MIDPTLPHCGRYLLGVEPNLGRNDVKRLLRLTHLLFIKIRWNQLREHNRRRRDDVDETQLRREGPRKAGCGLNRRLGKFRISQVDGYEDRVEHLHTLLACPGPRLRSAKPHARKPQRLANGRICHPDQAPCPDPPVDRRLTRPDPGGPIAYR